MIRRRTINNTIYQAEQIDQTKYSETVWFRKSKIDAYALLKQEKCSQANIFVILEVPKRTIQRWQKAYRLYGLEGLEKESTRPKSCKKRVWTPCVEQRVLRLRQEEPLWGKEKLTVIYYKRYGNDVSQSTLGRIITKLLHCNQIRYVADVCGKKIARRTRVLNHHAKRWELGMKSSAPGELVQIDHMSRNVPGLGIVKHFNAICPFTKYVVQHIYKQATSYNATNFLRRVIAQMPFTIRSIQVDGGSEFMAEFENLCKELNIPLFVLPPRSPKYNGGVERANLTFKYDFYNMYDDDLTLETLRQRLASFTLKYNTYRPHKSISLLTPQQYYELLKIGDQVPYVKN